MSNNVAFIYLFQFLNEMQTFRKFSHPIQLYSLCIAQMYVAKGDMTVEEGMPQENVLIYIYMQNVHTLWSPELTSSEPSDQLIYIQINEVCIIPYWLRICCWVNSTPRIKLITNVPFSR